MYCHHQSHHEQIETGMLFKTLNLLRVLIAEDRYITKRDLFYSNRHIFATQRESDETLRLASAALGIPRDELHVIAAARGLAQGAFSQSLDGAPARSMADEVTMLHPLGGSVLSDLAIDFDFVLIVEKETVFQRLVESCYPARARCLLVTVRAREITRKNCARNDSCDVH